ncbi:MAG: hypothetical protein JSR30_13185 [Proteobacteria bacterium]|nr:hypothetical protein [Pseudomonadota bacterium]
MAHITEDRVLETSTTTGTGALTLAGAVTGFRAFGSVMTSPSDTCWYALWAVDANGNATGDYEEGLGTYSAANTLTRTTILRSSNANAVVTLAAGTKYVAIAALAQKALQLDDKSTVLLPSNGSAGPTTPPAGFTGLFVKPQGGRLMPAFVGPSGLDSVLQPHLAKNGWGSWKPTFTGTTISAIGGPALTATGTATSAPWAATSLHTRVQRVDYLVTTAATTAVAGYRVAAATWRMDYGFHWIFRTCPATGATVSTRRCFIGLAASTAAPTDVNPSTLLNVLGLGYDAADTNWQVMVNDGTGTCTKIDTGLARPSSDRQTMYSIIIFSPPGGAWVGFRIVDEATGSFYESAQISTNVPATTQNLTPNCYASVGGTSSVVGLTFGGMWFDTDN